MSCRNAYRIRHGAAWSFALAVLPAWVACSGTQAEYPLTPTGDGAGDYVSLATFGSPSSSLVTPPCAGPLLGDFEAPQALPRGLAFDVPNRGSFVAQASDRGLEFWAVSDPANPARRSEGSVRGLIHEVLAGGASQLWVAATEPPSLDQAELPAAGELDSALRLVHLDVSNPESPVRLGEVTLSDDFWQMQVRGDTVWALTRRPIAADRGCAAPAPAAICGYQYEAFELHGFAQKNGALVPIAGAELPFGSRLWWGSDGVATQTDDGTLHVLRWDESGALQAPLDVPFPGAEFEPFSVPSGAIGAAEIVGNQLLWVVYIDGHAVLERFDLNADVTQPSSFDLGAAEFGLFWNNQLWGVSDEGEGLLWDLGGGTPERVALPPGYSEIRPLPGASLDGSPGVPLALGWTSLANGPSRSLDVLTIDGSNVSVAELVTLDTPTFIDSLDELVLDNSSFSAPADLHGIGHAPAWSIVESGMWLPFEIQPSIPGDSQSTSVAGFAGIASGSGELRAEATLFEPLGAAPHVVIQTGSGTTSFDVPSGSHALVPVPQGLVVVTNAPSSACGAALPCKRSVTLIDVSGEPRLAGTLPLPVPDLVRAGDPTGSSTAVSWTSHDFVTGDDWGPQLFDAEHLAFVADAQLGAEQQSVHLLQIAGPGAPSWQTIGISHSVASPSVLSKILAFAAPRVLGGSVALTRLARSLPSGDRLPEGEYRFVLDRFRLNGARAPQVAPEVNIPGYPVAYLGSDADAEYWVSVEALASPMGQARLHRLVIGADGATSENELDLAAFFGGFWPLQVDDQARGIALGNPTDACGVTELSALVLGAASPGGTIAVTSQLDLPEDDWHVAGSNGPRVLLQRDANYALVELDASGTLQLIGLKSAPGSIAHPQLLGTTVRGVTGTESVTIEF